MIARTQFVSLAMASIAFVLAFSGVLSVIASFLFKKWFQEHATQPIAKRLMAICRIIAAITGIFISQFKYSDEFLYVSVIAAAVAYFSWELTAIAAEERSKFNLARLKVLERNSERLRSLLTTLGEFVASKKASIAESVKNMNENTNGKAYETKAKFSNIRDTLDPEGHIKDLLRRLTSILVYDSQSASKPTKQWFRVCLYIEENGHMVEKCSFDSDKQSTASTKSYKSLEHRHRYNLDNQSNPSVIVRSIIQNTILIVPDCVESGICFTDEQKTRLKSMISYPFSIGYDPKKPQVSALVVDTNVPGHFTESDSGFLEDCLLEYSKRIELEIMYGELLKPESERNRQTPVA